MMADYCWSFKQEDIPEAFTDSKHPHIRREKKAQMVWPTS